jgi:hypothetical protein
VVHVRQRERHTAALEIHPLTPSRWNDLVTLFNGRGGSQVRGCWCTPIAWVSLGDKPVRDRDDSMWFGAKSMYDRASFSEVARRKPLRPVVRKTLRGR